MRSVGPTRPGKIILFRIMKMYKKMKIKKMKTRTEFRAPAVIWDDQYFVFINIVIIGEPKWNCGL